MKRRDFLTIAAATSLGGCRLTLEQGLMSACATGKDLLRNPLVARAWEGLRPDRVWDVHTHVFGNGRSGGGIWVAPDYDRPQSLGARVRHAFFMNGGCVGDDQDRLDQGMVARLLHLADEFPPGAKFMLLAFDFTFDESGARREDLTTFSVPNAYAQKIARLKPERFEWIASIHPYRADAVPQLEAAKRGGARAVKWLPPAMGIDLRSPKCHAFYDAMARLDVPLLVHLGEEQAVPGAGRHELANPLHVRAALERGVRVIAAHCASLGTSPDIDASKDPDKAPLVENFELFARLMGERAYEGRLFGDLSAVTQANRAGALARLIEMAPKWEGRLLNGSDYPLPGIMPLFSMSTLVAAGLLDEAVVPAIRELRNLNAFLFDFVLKRNLRFPASVFETRGFFEQRAPSPFQGEGRGEGSHV